MGQDQGRGGPGLAEVGVTADEASAPAVVVLRPAVPRQALQRQGEGAFSQVEEVPPKARILRVMN